MGSTLVRRGGIAAAMVAGALVLMPVAANAATLGGGASYSQNHNSHSSWAGPWGSRSSDNNSYRDSSVGYGNGASYDSGFSSHNDQAGPNGSGTSSSSDNTSTSTGGGYGDGGYGATAGGYQATGLLSGLLGL